MSNDPRQGVTDHAGQVHGHPGLFVMDAAAFPGSVGVNPSATIAAVAERKMAQLLGQPKQMEDARAWWARQAWKHHEKVSLEPRRAGRWVSTVNRPVGLEFSEEMSGFHYAEPVPGNDDDVAYRAAEVEGRRHENLLSLRLRATIEDVAAFIHSRDHAIQVEGTACLIWRAAGITTNTASRVSGTLSLFGSPHGAGQRLMRYELRFDELPFALAGYKRIRNDPGPDAWRDTSALFTTLSNPKSGARSYGVIHVALDGFLFDQLPSFHVTNTDDPARIAWTLASFGSYFFGQVQRIYVPQLERVVEGFAGLEIR
jgi:cholesterol oxidase